MLIEAQIKYLKMKLGRRIVIMIELNSPQILQLTKLNSHQYSSSKLLSNNFCCIIDLKTFYPKLYTSQDHQIQSITPLVCLLISSFRFECVYLFCCQDLSALYSFTDLDLRIQTRCPSQYLVFNLFLSIKLGKHISFCRSYLFLPALSHIST